MRSSRQLNFIRSPQFLITSFEAGRVSNVIQLFGNDSLLSKVLVLRVGVIAIMHSALLESNNQLSEGKDCFRYTPFRRYNIIRLYNCQPIAYCESIAKDHDGDYIGLQRYHQ